MPAVGRASTGWEGTGWRGERLNAVILVWSRDPLEQVRLETSVLADGRGRVLSRESLRLQMVRYVLSNYPAGASNATCDAAGTQAWLLPDRLEALDCFDLPGRTVRPVWLSLDIPSGAAPGKAGRGHGGGEDANPEHGLRLKVTVQAAQLPPPSAWSFRLDLWQNPWVIAWYDELQPWSEAHRASLKQAPEALCGRRRQLHHDLRGPLSMVRQFLHDRRRDD